MTQIAIPDEVAADLASAAVSRGCTQDALASQLILEGLRKESDFHLTHKQSDRLMKSLAQANRGELIDGDIVMNRFDSVLREIESR